MLDQVQNQIGVEPASEQEEAEYAQAIEYAVQSLNTGQVAQNTAKRVLNAESIEKGVAQAVFVLVRRTEEQFGGLSDAVKIQVAEDLLMEVLGLLIDSGRLEEEAITDEMIEKITIEMYQSYAQDAEQRGALDPSKVQQDVAEAEAMLGQQGVNAMSNESASQAKGLMNV